MHPTPQARQPFPTGPAPADPEFGLAADAARTSLYWRGLARSIRAGMTVHHTTARRCDDVARRYEREVLLVARRAELSGADLMDAQDDAQDDVQTSTPAPAAYPFDSTPAQTGARAAMEHAARHGRLAGLPACFSAGAA